MVAVPVEHTVDQESMDHGFSTTQIELETGVPDRS
jgi:hypothetical protein